MLREKFSEWRQKRCQNRQEMTKKERVIKALKITFFAFFPIILYMLVEWLQGVLINPATVNFWINLLFYYGFSFLVYGLSKSLFLYTLIPSIIMWLLAAINHYMILLRNKPLLPWEVFALVTAKNVAGTVTISIDAVIVATFLITAGLCVLAWFIRKTPFFKKPRLISLIACVLCFALFVGILWNPPKSISSSSWKPVNASMKNGLAVNLAHSLRSLVNRPPEGYSVEKVREIVGNGGYEEYKTEEQPDIIVIMDESFGDFYRFADLQTSEDLIPFVHSMLKDEKTVSGTVRVSVFGGGTCNSEYEFLTGNTVPLLREGSYPMVQFIAEKNPSIVRNFKDRGYRTIGIHPFHPDGWSRNTSYPRLGFDKFYSNLDFENPEIIREYISDAESFRKVIDVLEEDPSKPAFIFNVTMQNHSSFDQHHDNFVETANFPDMESYPKAKQYLSLLTETDNAIKGLIEYLETRDRPTVLLFYGDHFPALEDEFYDSLQEREGYSEDEMDINMHTTPFFIWANYDIGGDLEKRHGNDISIPFLSPLFLKAAGLPMTDYQAYLFNLSRKMPFWEEGSAKELEEYKIVQYNMVFDEDGYQGDLFE